MAISFRNANSNTTTSGSQLVVNKPTGTVEGDLIVTIMALEDSTDRWEPDPGVSWTTVVNSVIGTRAHRQYVLYRLAGSSEPAEYIWTINAADEWLVIMAIFTGVHEVDPVGNYAVSTDNASSTDATSPGITIQKVDNWALAVASNMYGSTWTAPIATGPQPPYTEHKDIRTGTAADSISAILSSLSIGTAGLTSSAISVSSVADYWKASHIELRQYTYKNTVFGVTTHNVASIYGVDSNKVASVK